MKLASLAGCAAAVLVAAVVGGPRVSAADFVIGTGSPNGIYFHVGRSICRLVERAVVDTGCQPVETEGSLFNLSNVLSGGLELGLAQSDWHYNAVTKTGPFEFVASNYDDLRSLFSVHSEIFTVVARRDAGVESFEDLKGKRVNIGNPGSGHRANMELVMAAKGWTMADFLVAQEMTAAEHVLALCHDRIQALVYTVGHPNPSIGKALGLCGAKLVNVTGPAIEKLIAENPYYSWAAIPAGVYPASPDPVRGFGVRATLVTTTDVDPELVYRIVKAVFEDLETFKSYHPAFQTLEPKRMITEGLTAPLHEGAVRYYREAGLM